MDRDALLARIVRGGFPEIVDRRVERRAEWFESYLTAVVEREVRAISALGDGAALTTVLRLVAARQGSPFNLADVARGAALPHSTARRYLSLLQAIYLVVAVPAWATSLTTTLVRSPKMVLADSGLAAHLLGVDLQRLRSRPELLGPLLEAFVAIELRKQIGWSRSRPKLHHFRSRQGEEVDLVLETRTGHVVGIEVKASSTVRSGDLRGLRALEQLTGDRFRRGVVLYSGPSVVPFSRTLSAVPVQALWSVVT